MSLQSLLEGYSESRVEYALEGVDVELTMKYDSVNGPVAMAMEAADMLHEIYMESFYDTNELEISAAMEGVSVLEETTPQGKTFKEKISSAWHKLGTLFRKFVDWLGGMLKDLWDKIKKGATNTKNFIKNIPSNIKSRIKKVEYEGYKYTNLETYSKFASKVQTTSKNFSGLRKKLEKLANQTLKAYKKEKDEDITYESIEEDMSKEADNALADIKKLFGIDKDVDGDAESTAIFSYFRGGAKRDEKTQQKISLHEAESAVDNAEKMIKDIDSMFKTLSGDYEDHAKFCEIMADRGSKSEFADTKPMYALVNTQRQLAAYCNKMNTFVTKVTSAWTSVVMERSQQYAKAIKDAADKASGGTEQATAEGYLDFDMDDTEFVMEGANVDAIKTYVKKAHTIIIHDIKEADKEFKANHFDKAKSIYEKAAKDLSKVSDTISDIDDTIVSEWLSMAAGVVAGYIVEWEDVRRNFITNKTMIGSVNMTNAQNKLDGSRNVTKQVLVAKLDSCIMYCKRQVKKCNHQKSSD